MALIWRNTCPSDVTGGHCRRLGRHCRRHGGLSADVPQGQGRYPDHPDHYLRIIPVPAFIMLGLWFALQLFQSVDQTRPAAAWPMGAFRRFLIGALLTIPLWLRRVALRIGIVRMAIRHILMRTYKYVKSSVPVVRRR